MSSGKHGARTFNPVNLFNALRTFTASRFLRCLLKAVSQWHLRGVFVPRAENNLECVRHELPTG